VVPPSMACARFVLTPRILSVVIVAVLLFLFAVGAARASSYPDPCGGPNNFDYASCERLDVIAQQAEDQTQFLGWILGAVLFGITVPIWRGVTGRNG
jgi:hypothetical protein